jgi:DNA-binding transcriptional MerR regulator
MKLSIASLEQLSGVPVHTIRMWERRYNALKPLRSEGNTRFYSDDQLKRLLNLVSLTQSGLKISKACALNAQEVDQFLALAMDHTISTDAHFEMGISQLLKYGLTYNEFEFDKVLNAMILKYGVSTCYQQLIYPLLQRLGLMWQRDHICPAQEHFVSDIIRRKLMVAIDGIPLNKKPTLTWLLFLPEDETHDIPLLFSSYLLRSQGFKVLYLGASVPLESLKDAMNYNKVDQLLFFMIRQRPVNEATQYIDDLLHHFHNTKIHLAGNGNLIGNITLNEKVNWFKSIPEFQLQIQALTDVK